jgi:hypothetical protein
MNDKANPLESIFNIEPGSTPVFHDIHVDTAAQINERASTLIDPTNGEIVARSSSPEELELEKEERIEDLHIDGQLETVHTYAIIAFEKSSRMAEEVDPKFAARNAEVAAQYLTIALNAVSSRVDAKYKRAKVKITKEKKDVALPNRSTVIIMDRNTLLKEILGNKEKNIVDAEEVK